MLQEKDYRLLVVDYCTTKLDQQYLELVYRLKSSADSLQEKPPNPGMIESFTLGGEVLHLLAKDPCLPAALQGPSDRQRLWQTMLLYDNLGQSICLPTHGNMPTSITSFG